MKESEIKVAREVAESDFQEWCDANEIDTDVSAMSEEDEEKFLGIKRRIVSAVMRGRLVFEGENCTYTISEHSEKFAGQKVEIKKPLGSAFITNGNFKGGQEMKRMYAMLSDMTGLTDGAFMKMSVIDVKLFIGIVTLFLAD